MSSFDPGAFVPGSVFAGRYRMVNRIGAADGGAVWRADDLILQTVVALKVIDPGSSRVRDRMLSEVRLARQITHPAVCRVFDAGEADGCVFYSMELVHGQDLAALLRQTGRLLPDRVLDIGQQICDGLGTAHGLGILHRALTPATVLIDENGLVRLTDIGFGISDDDTQDFEALGATDYMAPEQLRPGGLVSEQTDLYAVGVILYELLTATRPFGAGASRLVQPPKPSSLVPDVPAALERTIMQALSMRPGDRPASAGAMAAKLAAPSGGGRRRAPWLAGAAVAAVVGLLAVSSALLMPRGARALTDQDTIVLADFQNTTGDPVFDGTLKVALAVALEQSPFLKIFPDDRVAETLQLMEAPPNERVTRSVAREIARREQLKAFVAGSISSLGSHYVLALEAVNAATGDVMARDQGEAASKEEVLNALSASTARLRERLGESLATIQKFDVPLARATTASLSALHAYSVAVGQGRTVPGLEAVPHLTRALELDPNFAMAQALLSGVYMNFGQTAEAPAYSRRAFELRDRVSERERFFLSWRYYVDATQEWDKALELARSWAVTYPRETYAFNSLGLATAAFGQHEEAVAAFREAIRLDPKFVPPHRNLIGSLIALNRFDEAASLQRQAVSGGIASVGMTQLGYLLAFVHDDATAVDVKLREARAPEGTMWSLHSTAREALAAGRFQTAHDLLQQSVETARRERLDELGAHWTTEDAEAHALAGQCPEARREAAAGLALARDNFTLERASRTLAWCGAAGDAMKLSAELAERFPNATLTSRIQRPITAAAVAMQGGDASKAVTLLDGVKPWDHAPVSELWPAYLRGEAYLRLRDGQLAAAQFQSVLDHRGEAPTSPLYALAHLGAARAAVLSGDSARARLLYRRFLDLWKDADAHLPYLDRARAESAQLP
jgi:tetratricopeptide (TPR) repeat protein